MINIWFILNYFHEKNSNVKVSVTESAFGML